MWRGEEEALEALEAGKKALTQSTPDLQAKFDNLSSSEASMFKLGLYEKLMDMMAKRAEGDDLSKVFRDKKIRDVLRIVLGKDSADKFIESLGNEGKMAATFAQIKNTPLIDSPHRANVIPSMSARMAVFQKGREAASRVYSDLRGVARRKGWLARLREGTRGRYQLQGEGANSEDSQRVRVPPQLT